MALKRATMGDQTKFGEKRQRDRHQHNAARKSEREQAKAHRGDIVLIGRRRARNA
jgi:hypothetical protein